MSHISRTRISHSHSSARPLAPLVSHPASALSLTVRPLPFPHTLALHGHYPPLRPSTLRSFIPPILLHLSVVPNSSSCQFVSRHVPTQNQGHADGFRPDWCVLLIHPVRRRRHQPARGKGAGAHQLHGSLPLLRLPLPLPMAGLFRSPQGDLKYEGTITPAVEMKWRDGRIGICVLALGFNLMQSTSPFAFSPEAGAENSSARAFARQMGACCSAHAETSLAPSGFQGIGSAGISCTHQHYYSLCCSWRSSFHSRDYSRRMRLHS